jgi:hypothetical protein
MPALTLSAINQSLNDYVRPDFDFITSLNMVLPRIYSMGYWRDLVYEDTIMTDHEYFSLPDGAESLLAATIDDSTASIRSLWHDIKLTGGGTMTQGSGPDPMYGVVDDGYAPSIIDLNRSKQYKLYARPMVEGGNITDCGRVIVSYLNTNGELGEEIFQLDGSTAMVGANEDATRITSIVFESVSDDVKIVAVNTDDVPTVDFAVDSGDWNTSILTLARGEGNAVARYRRYRLSNPSDSSKSVRLLMKRKFIPLRSAQDIVYLGNLNVLKHGLLGFIAEDNADVERAQYHWGTCRVLLEEEMDAHRGAAKPTVKFNPSGAGAISVPNLM